MYVCSPPWWVCLQSNWLGELGRPRRKRECVEATEKAVRWTGAWLGRAAAPWGVFSSQLLFARLAFTTWNKRPHLKECMSLPCMMHYSSRDISSLASIIFIVRRHQHDYTSLIIETTQGTLTCQTTLNHISPSARVTHFNLLDP